MVIMTVVSQIMTLMLYCPSLKVTYQVIWLLHVLDSVRQLLLLMVETLLDFIFFNYYYFYLMLFRVLPVLN